MALRKPRQFWNDLRSDWTSRTRRDLAAANLDNGGAALQQSEAQGHLRRVMPDLYFVNTPAAHMVRHWKLLRDLPRENIALDFHRHDGARLTDLTICAIDGTEPGLLSKVCGTLSAFNIDVKSALIYTARGEDLARELSQLNIEYSIEDSDASSFDASHSIVLDTLVLSEAYRGQERALSEGTQKQVQAEIKRVLRGAETVYRLLSRRRNRPPSAILLHHLAVVPQSEGGGAIITLRAQDSVGILYRTTTAISGLKLNIRIAQINTHDGVTDDIFFVANSDGKPLDQAECDQLAARLRTLLQRLDVPMTND